MEKLRAELESRVKLPGLSNAWVMPIRTRIDMLATGIKTLDCCSSLMAVTTIHRIISAKLDVIV